MSRRIMFKGLVALILGYQAWSSASQAAAPIVADPKETREMLAALKAADVISPAPLAEKLVAVPGIVAPRALVESMKNLESGYARLGHAFFLEDGHVVWMWGLTSSVPGSSQQIEKHLLKAWDGRGFEAEKEKKFNGSLVLRRPFKAAKCEEVIELDPIPGFALDDIVTVDLNWKVRSLETGGHPTYAEIVEAMPSLDPLKAGEHPLPKALFQTLTPLTPTLVSYGGHEKHSMLMVKVLRHERNPDPLDQKRLRQLLIDDGLVDLKLSSDKMMMPPKWRLTKSGPGPNSRYIVTYYEHPKEIELRVSFQP